MRVWQGYSDHSVHSKYALDYILWQWILKYKNAEVSEPVSWEMYL